MIGLPLQIGPLRLSSNLMLAPIAGWCDLSWRVTCRAINAGNAGLGLASTDLLSPKGLLMGTETSRDLARTSDLDRPVGMQLYGSDPAILAEGARWCADRGAAVVDINMGCPVDKVCKKDGGSKLMCIPDTAVRIAAAVRAALPESVPMTCKMRLGWTQADADRNAAGELACRLIDAGAALITVHGRTTEQHFKGHCSRLGIRRVVERVAAHTGPCTGPGTGIPVVANGDVRTADDAMDMLRQTGAAGVMIGRGAFACPWVFTQAWEHQLAAVESRPPRDLEPSEDAKLDFILAYFARLLEFRGQAKAIHVIGQKISWLGKTINGSHCRALKDGVRSASTPDEVVAAVEAWRCRAHDRPSDPPEAIAGPENHANSVPGVGSGLVHP
ncbi:MAG: tRNA dihydrouridine synthase [Phycisphaerales bacterium JB037]